MAFGYSWYLHPTLKIISILMFFQLVSQSGLCSEYWIALFHIILCGSYIIPIKFQQTMYRGNGKILFLKPQQFE